MSTADTLVHTADRDQPAPETAAATVCGMSVDPVTPDSAPSLAGTATTFAAPDAGTA
jgi:hypothetical protein